MPSVSAPAIACTFFFLFRFRFLFFGGSGVVADAGVGSSESPVGVSGGGKSRFLLFDLAAEGFLGVGSRVLSGCRGRAPGLVVGSLLGTLESLSIVGAARTEPVRGSLAFLDVFFSFLVVAMSRDDC